MKTQVFQKLKLISSFSFFHFGYDSDRYFYLLHAKYISLQKFSEVVILTCVTDEKSRPRKLSNLAKTWYPGKPAHFLYEYHLVEYYSILHCYFSPCDSFLAL